MKLSVKSFHAFMTVIAAIAITSAITISSISNVFAKVEGDTIILGSAISLTGKYATNGLHTQRGYDYAVKVINEKGGVTVGGKSYQLAVKYYDDESTPARGGSTGRKTDPAGWR